MAFLLDWKKALYDEHNLKIFHEGEDIYYLSTEKLNDNIKINELTNELICYIQINQEFNEALDRNIYHINSLYLNPDYYNNGTQFILILFGYFSSQKLFEDRNCILDFTFLLNSNLNKYILELFTELEIIEEYHGDMITLQISPSNLIRKLKTQNSWMEIKYLARFRLNNNYNINNEINNEIKDDNNNNNNNLIQTRLSDSINFELKYNNNIINININQCYNRYESNLEHTGSCVWESSKYLLNYLSLNSSERSLYTESLENKKILELGSGLGLLSIGLAKLGAYIISTDGDEELNNIRNQNIIENNVENNVLMEVLKFGDDINRQRIINESMNNFFMEKNLDNNIDIIVAADIIYNINLLPLFRQELLILHELYPNAIILYAHQFRFLTRENLFFETLQEFFEIDVYENEDNDPKINIYKLY